MSHICNETMGHFYENNRLPDAFVVGAAKSGTTSLYHMLAAHPSLFFPPGEKEPFFFCFGNQKPKKLDSRIAERVTWKEQSYFSLYSKAAEDAIAMDASTAYLYRHEEVIQHMKRYYGNQLSSVKIIILLRNPVERAWSHYLYLIRNGHETLDFEEAIKPECIARRTPGRWGFDYLGYGAYGAQVRAFVDCFPHTLIRFTEDLNDHNHLLSDVHQFLGVAHYPQEKGKKTNPSGVPKNRFLVNHMRNNKWLKKAVNQLPENLKHRLLEKRDSMMEDFLVKAEMDSKTKTQLQAYFADDIRTIEKITGRDLSAWTI